jgi:SAM-dependent methyltransferase
MVPRAGPYPLDLAETDYSYIERPNPALVALADEHVLGGRTAPRLLDVGCGCGANARALVERAPGARIVGIEPNPRAAALAAEVCSDVFCGELEAWLQTPRSDERFDGVVLSDVLEHVADPVGFLRRLLAAPAVQQAVWIISVPNYAVWYNRARTLAGRFDYWWSGLYDRTHLRFYTRRSIHQLLRYCGFELLDWRCSSSLAQSAVPLLRRFFERDVAAGNHLALLDSPVYRFYQRLVEPVETGLCQLWPELLGFQIVSAVRPSAAPSANAASSSTWQNQ